MVGIKTGCKEHMQVVMGYISMIKLHDVSFVGSKPSCRVKILPVTNFVVDTTRHVNWHTYKLTERCIMMLNKLQTHM